VVAAVVALAVVAAFGFAAPVLVLLGSTFFLLLPFYCTFAGC
jgi:hypothetical protein